MMKKINKFRKLWSLAKKDEKLIDEMASIIQEHEQLKSNDVKIKMTGNGKATFIPLMSEAERDEYLKNQEPFWKKVNEKLKEIIK